MEEIWMYIESYGKLYKISNFGRVWSTRMDREMIPGIDGGVEKMIDIVASGTVIIIFIICFMVMTKGE